MARSVEAKVEEEVEDEAVEAGAVPVAESPESTPGATIEGSGASESPEDPDVAGTQED